MPRGDQLSRQWRLLQMIDRPQGVTVDAAACELECTIRMTWRDLDALQKAGFPLYTERAADGNRGVWRVTEDFKRALPLKLTLGELAALLTSRDVLMSLGVRILPRRRPAFARPQGAFDLTDQAQISSLLAFHRPFPRSTPSRPGLSRRRDDRRFNFALPHRSAM